MFDFFLGVLVGGLIIDVAWAWKTGLLSYLMMNFSGRYKLFKINRSEWLQKLLP